ncbi:MAG: endonuclease [Oligoflexia bacterium]|nr:MAG: endonuclease [Oligoflexia bacterium]
MSKSLTIVKLLHYGFLVLLTSLLLSCSSKQIQEHGLPPKPEFLMTKQKGGRFSVMAYNVENLFDTEKDENRKDWEYLPLSLKASLNAKAYCDTLKSSYQQKECLEKDWNEEILKKKMSQLADSILQVRDQGPDILMLEEVENIKILKRFNKEYLQKAGYITEVLIEGDDQRGIDIGLLSRFPLSGTPKLHKIETLKNTRGIQEVVLKLPTGQTVTILGLHFPSQGNPHQHRVDAVNTLNKIAASKKSEDLIIAGGDFNITTEEDRDSKLFEKTLGEKWYVTHQIGCKTCKGTHNYKGSWSFLDALLFSKNFNPSNQIGVALLPDTILTPMWGKTQALKTWRPARFRDDGTGVSDHLPIYAEFEVR